MLTTVKVLEDESGLAYVMLPEKIMDRLQVNIGDELQVITINDDAMMLRLVDAA